MQRLLLLLLLPLLGCPSPGDDDDSGADDDDDATTPLPPESDCLDGVDNDLDTLVDCDDPDCALVQQCTWPRALSHAGSFDYDASLLAELAGYDDCRTDFLADLTEEEVEANQCPTCDRTFSGPMTYPADDCPEGDEPRPTAVSYGIGFFNDLQWEVFVQDAQFVWTSVGFAVQTEGTWTLTRTDEVDVDGTDAGDLVTTLSFTPPVPE
jgi:hypothetical protein